MYAAGYDVLLDDSAQPWLVEVNHSPSFATGAPIDCAVKEALIADTLTLVRNRALVDAAFPHMCAYSPGAWTMWTYGGIDSMQVAGRIGCML